jgi:hypothetical protein
MLSLWGTFKITLHTSDINCGESKKFHKDLRENWKIFPNLIGGMPMNINF